MVEATTEQVSTNETAAEQQPVTAAPEEESKAVVPASKTQNRHPRTLREQFNHGISLKEEGNLAYKAKDYSAAIKCYALVRTFLRPFMPREDGQDQSQFVNMFSQADESDDKLTKAEIKQAIQVQASTFLNLSICWFLKEQWQKSIDRATESIQLQKNVKAYYRRAQGYAKIRDFWRAAADLKEAISMDKTDPNNFAQELARFEAMGA